MNKLYLSKNLTFLGSFALGAITFTGIVATPAQAAIIGTASFDADGILTESGDLSTATLGNIGDFADEGYTGIFNPNGLPTVPPGGVDGDEYRITTVENLVLTQVVGNEYTNGFIDDFKEYTNVNGETITFDLDAGATWIRTVDALGGVGYSNPGGYTGTYAADDLAIQNQLGPSPNGAGFLQFSEAAGLIFAEIEVTQEVEGPTSQVPEPTTILGLLTFGSLGLALNRKKQS